MLSTAWCLTVKLQFKRIIFKCTMNVPTAARESRSVDFECQSSCLDVVELANCYDINQMWLSYFQPLFSMKGYFLPLFILLVRLNEFSASCDINNNFLCVNIKRKCYNAVFYDIQDNKIALKKEHILYGTDGAYTLLSTVALTCT